MTVVGSGRATGHRRRTGSVGRAPVRTGVGSLTAILGLVGALSGCGAGPGEAEDLDAADGSSDLPEGDPAGTGTADDADGGEDADGGDRGSGPDLNPSAEDPDRVEPHIDELLAGYDRVVNDIVADPSVAGDEDTEVVDDLRALFEPDSEFVDDLVDGWVAMADDGRRTVPYSDDHPAGETRLDGPLVAESDNEVTFPVCVIRRSRVVGPDDEEVGGALPRLDQSGEGSAVRTDEGWLLRELVVDEGGLGCEEES